MDLLHILQKAVMQIGVDHMANDKHTSIISKENWSLHRKGEQDQQRHKEKIQEAIKNKLHELVSEENIILSNGQNVVKIPIKSLDEYKIRYNTDKSQHVGQGDGKSQVGDIVAKDGKAAQGQGKGKEASDKAGEDYYEAEVQLADIEEILFQQLALPNLKEKDKQHLVTKDIIFNDVRKKGLMGNIDKKRTILTAIKRNAAKGKPALHPILEDDLRFKTWTEEKLPQSQAVVLAMMDTSGSMGLFEKTCARNFFFWMTRFLRSKYQAVDIQFIAHHTEAKIVTEEAFFTKGESGGTICSSAYEKALELIKSHYNPQQYNIYPIHFSDGENLASDNARCVELIGQLMAVSSMFGYAEVNSYSRTSALMSVYSKISDDKFRSFIIKRKSDVYEALKSIFQKEGVQ